MAADFTTAQVITAFRPAIQIFFARLNAAEDRTSGLSFTGPRAWYRTRAQNDAVNGEFESQHRVALGADLTAHVDNDVLVGVLEDAGVIAFNEGTHVHAQLFMKGALARAGVDFSRLP